MRPSLFISVVVLPVPGGAKDHNPAIEGQPENLVLVFIQQWLIPQPHFHDDTAAKALDDIGCGTFFHEQFVEEIGPIVFLGSQSKKIAKRFDRDRAEFRPLDP